MTNRCSNDMSMNANGDNGLYTLDSEELRAAKSKNGIENRLMFAICLKFLQLEGRYPTNNDVTEQSMISGFVAQIKYLLYFPLPRNMGLVGANSNWFANLKHFV